MLQRKTKTAWLFLFVSLLSVWVTQEKLTASAIGLSLLPQPKAADNSAKQDARELKFGETLKGELLPGQTLGFVAKLTAGDFVSFEMIVQNNKEELPAGHYSAGAQLTLYDPKGVFYYREFHSSKEISSGFSQTLKRIVEIDGYYRLEATARKPQKTPSPYQLRITALRRATESDHALQQAEIDWKRAEHLCAVEQKFDEGISLSETALMVFQKLQAPEEGDVGNTAIALIGCYERRNYHRDQQRIAQLWELTAQNRATFWGPNHINVAIIYDRLVDVLDPARAQKWFQRMMEILVQTVGEEHEFVAVVLNEWGNSIEKLGDKARAAEMYERSVRMTEKVKGPEHHSITGQLTSLGIVQAERKQWDEAEASLLRVLKIYENKTKEDFVEGNYDTKGFALQALAELYQSKRDYQQADAYQQEMQSFYQTHKLSHHRAQAIPYRLKGNFMLDRGQYEEARQQFEIAQQALLKTGESPELATLLRDWRRLNLFTGREAEAVAVQKQAVAISENELKQSLAQGSEYEMLQLMTLYKSETDETLALHTVNAPDSVEALELAFTIWLQRKGRTLDEMNKTLAHIRNSADQESAALLQQLIDHYSQVSLLKTRAPEEKDLAPHQQRLKQLQQETEQLEVTLSQRNARFRVQVQPVTLAAVQQALPADAALVEFARFNPKDVKTQEPLGEQYVAYILLADGTLRWTPLGKAEEIEAAVRDWLEALGKAPTPTSAVTLSRLARRLDALVMQPVRKQLGTTRRVLLAPDGILNLVPFAALVDASGRELVRDYLFSYLTSGRDLLRLQVKHQSADDVLVFAAPDYNDGSDVSNQATAPSMKDERRGRVSQSRSAAALGKWKPLQFAEAEARAIQQQLPQAKLYLGKQASEAALKQVHRPRILHVVTHGAFLEDQQWEAQQGRTAGDTVAPRAWENPLLRSWLALAGANQRKSGDEDGILTAYEAAALDLWGTKLVVLSACETGLGKLHNGEGVYGMRRALALAGAETQLTSLWKVSDRVTRRLMQSYYAKLAVGVGRAEALRQVQLELLKSKANASPYYWAAFIAIGEWANLEGVRK